MALALLSGNLQIATCNKTGVVDRNACEWLE
jgi:hypothetical protein